MPTDIATWTGYVITEDGTVLLQLPDRNPWGFVLADDGQTWDGGFGIATSWLSIESEDPRITPADRERLQWMLDDHECSEDRPRHTGW